MIGGQFQLEFSQGGVARDDAAALSHLGAVNDLVIPLDGSRIEVMIGQAGKPKSVRGRVAVLQRIQVAS